MDLVEGRSSQILAVLVARIEVGNLRPPAIDRLNATRRIENDVTIGKVARFKIGESLSSSFS